MQLQQVSRKLRIFSIALTGLWACTSFNKYLHARKMIQQLEKEDIQVVENQNCFKELQGLGKKIALVKMKFAQSNQSKCTRKVGSIQYFYDVFPIEQNIRKVIDGQKQRNAYIIKHNYKQTQRGFFGSILFGFGSALAFLINLVVSSIDIRGKPVLIGGPQIGVLQTTVRIATDRPLIVQLQLINGQLVPKFCGLTKNNILNFWAIEKYAKILGFLISTLCLYFNRHFIKRNIIKPIKQIFQEIIGRFKVASKKQNKGEFLNADVDNDLLCIICMNRCRNVIFDNCKHLIICNSCKKEYEGEQIDKCPLCRREINERYIYVKESIQEEK